MQKSILTAAALTLLAPLAHAVDVKTDVSTIVIDNATTSVVLTLSGSTWDGFFFSSISGLPVGQLTSVSVDATLDASAGYAFADDLAIYVTPTAALVSSGLLQIGGYSSLGAAQRYYWANGSSSSPGTTVVDTVTLLTPVSFTGVANGPTLWVGNGYAGTGSSATWTGTITLNFSAAAVPEPASWAMALAGGAGLLSVVARRRRRISNAA